MHKQHNGCLDQVYNDECFDDECYYRTVPFLLYFSNDIDELSAVNEKFYSMADAARSRARLINGKELKIVHNVRSLIYPTHWKSIRSWRNFSFQLW